MEKLIPTCAPENMTIVDGFVACTSWEFVQPMFPMVELSPEELALWMSATAAFLGACFASRMLVRTIFQAGNSD